MKNDPDSIIKLFDNSPETLRGASDKESLESYAREMLFHIRCNSIRTAPYKVLEIGCGDGLMTAALHEMMPHSEFSLMDVCPTLIRQAMRNNPKIKNYIIADCKKEIPNDESYDLIISWGLAQYLSHKEFIDMNNMFLKRLSGIGKIMHFSIPNEFKRYDHTMKERKSILSKTKGLIKYQIESMTGRYGPQAIWHSPSKIMKDLREFFQINICDGDVDYRFHLVIRPWE